MKPTPHPPHEAHDPPPTPNPTPFMSPPPLNLTPFKKPVPLMNRTPLKNTPSPVSLKNEALEK